MPHTQGDKPDNDAPNVLWTISPNALWAIIVYSAFGDRQVEASVGCVGTRRIGQVG